MQATKSRFMLLTIPRNAIGAVAHPIPVRCCCIVPGAANSPGILSPADTAIVPITTFCSFLTIAWIPCIR